MRLILLPRTIPTPNFLFPSSNMRFGILLIALFLSHFSRAQEKCGTQAPTTGEFENWISTRIESRKLQSLQGDTHAPLYQIPVVVHVFHKGEAVGTGVNLSDERIIAQIDSLTADFRQQNADAINTPADFAGVAVDTEIEFVLAKQDPAGNPTNGIVRINGDKKVYRVNSDKALLRSESFWSPEHYLNIYVADLQVFIGYASFPVTNLAGISNETDDFVLDAVYVDFEYFGNNPDAPSFESRGRTLTHEVGHFLGLRHIWGDTGCGGDDFVDDTPTSRFDHGGTTSPCTYPIPDNEITTAYDEGNTCTEEDDPDLPDMFQNYMDYTDDICMNLFTQGQKDRMRVVLENSPRRNSLLTSPGLTEPTRFANDLAATHIISPDFANCSNQVTPALLVTNFGTNDITTFDATFLVDGNPVGSVFNYTGNISPLGSDTIIFSNQIINTAPTTVSFAISNVNGTTDGDESNNMLSKEVTHFSNVILPFSEDFESGNSMMGTFGPSTIWEVVTAPKEVVTNQSIAFKAFNDQSAFGEATIIETPALDLNGVPSATLSFSYAYADNPGSFHDGLVVKASPDCGDNFDDVIFSLTGSKMKTATSTASSFTPANQLEWQDTTLGISSYRNFDEVKFRFIGLNGGNNNLYIDNILIQETDVLANDINLQALNGPLVTCDDDANLSLQIRNAGSETITSFSVQYELNGNSFNQSFTGISVGERAYETFTLNVSPLDNSGNEVVVNVVEVNNVTDQSAFGNTIEATILRDLTSDDYPLIVDFESSDNWINTAPSVNSLWERTSSDGNGVLRANSFDATELGIESWYISPALTTGFLDSAGLYFRASYASRAGRNDRLRVLASVNCGENYTMTLLDADSDSLAIAQTNDKWAPQSDADWKEFYLDLSSTIPFRDEIRVAFIFTNGNGNDLYIDDISIRGNEPPEYEQRFRTFPNPANLVFNLGFNLQQKEEVLVELINMSGKAVIRQTVPNALNQIVPFEAPNQSGIYFVRVTGRNFTQTQKLFISTN